MEKHWLLVLLSVFAMAGCVLGADDAVRSCESAVGALTRETGKRQADQAVRFLERTESGAFPVLIAHRDDNRKAAPWFQEDRFEEPTVGDVCFGIIQREVEGVWPTAYRDYHSLTRESLPEWWKSRQTKSLHELRVEAARNSLERAKKAHEKE